MNFISRKTVLFSAYLTVAVNAIWAANAPIEPIGNSTKPYQPMKDLL